MRMCRDSRTVTTTVFLALAMAGVVATSAKADEDVRSSPPDTTSYSRPLVPEDLTLGSTAGTAGLAAGVSFSVVDTVVNNTNPNLRITDAFNDGETSIAVNPRRRNEIVITAFSGGWGATAPLWLSRNGGGTWTKEFTINPPPGVAGVPGGPFDQTVDFGSFFNRLAGTFLTSDSNIYSAVTRNPTIPAFHYSGFPGPVAVKTNAAATVSHADQPWLLVGPRPGVIGGENVYVGYDHFTSPVVANTRVAVAAAADPPNFIPALDMVTGTSGPVGGVNPGHRLAIDPITGAVYSIFQQGLGGAPPTSTTGSTAPSMAA